MKVFVIFTGSSSPFEVEAESYTRNGAFIHFHAYGQIVSTVRVDGLLTILEEKDQEESPRAWQPASYHV